MYSLPVYNTFLDKSHESIADLPQYVNSTLFAQVRFKVDEFFKVAIANFLDYVVIMRAFHDIEHSNNVLRFKQLQNLYLREQCILQILVLID